MNVYPFIEAEKLEHRNVTKACELMEVSRSAFYDWHTHAPTRRQIDDGLSPEQWCRKPSSATVFASTSS